jgi:hypothetical protein
MIAPLNGLVFLFINYWVWPCFATFLSNYCILYVNNLGCAICTWIFMWIIWLVLLYLIRTLQIKLFCVTMSPNVYLNLQIVHCKIYGFIESTRKPSLIAINPQHINIQLWKFEVTTCVFIVTSCRTSTFDTLPIVNAHFQHLRLMRIAFEWG